MMKLQLTATAILILLFTISCEKEDPVIPNEEELITTLQYILTPTSGGDEVVLQFKDIDGDGGNDPVITVANLAANTTYSGRLELLNESTTPAESITEEIEEEDDEHQFFFESDINDLRVVYTDMDDNGQPIGLTTTVSTGNANTGSLGIVLRHQPDKSGAGVAGGDIANAGGGTDIEVSFNIVIQ